MANIKERSEIDISNMSFSEALIALKQGQKIARKGWNASGQYIYQYPANLEENNFQTFAVIKTVQGSLVPWLPSQSDLFAKDWNIILIL